MIESTFSVGDLVVVSNPLPEKAEALGFLGRVVQDTPIYGAPGHNVLFDQPHEGMVWNFYALELERAPLPVEVEVEDGITTEEMEATETPDECKKREDLAILLAEYFEQHPPAQKYTDGAGPSPAELVVELETAVEPLPPITAEEPAEEAKNHHVVVFEAPEDKTASPVLFAEAPVSDPAPRPQPVAPAVTLAPKEPAKTRAWKPEYPAHTPSPVPALPTVRIERKVIVAPEPRTSKKTGSKKTGHVFQIGDQVAAKRGVSHPLWDPENCLVAGEVVRVVAVSANDSLRVVDPESPTRGVADGGGWWLPAKGIAMSR